eukprot:scaffold636242_cov23-Prasinocladus_malaysianus.AAC.1
MPRQPVEVDGKTLLRGFAAAGVSGIFARGDDAVSSLSSLWPAATAASASLWPASTSSDSAPVSSSQPPR